MNNSLKKIQNYINGELVEPHSGCFIENFEPATGLPYSLVPDSDSQDIEHAVLAAERAFTKWSSTNAEKRAQILFRLAELIEKNLEELAQAEAIDNGKPITLARKVDIPRAALNFRFFASGISHFYSEFHSMGELALNYTLREPLGVVACISPWNLPLYLFTWKIAPALASGNCVVGKPSEVTPMTAFLFSKLCLEAGLPPGVLNIVHGIGSKLGKTLCTHPKIRAISFTGGTKTGAEISRLGAPLFKKLSLELGGKNPCIIFADCNYEPMLETTIQSSFSNQGQICLATSRILVEESLYARFRDDFVKKACELVVGDPLEEKTEQGAVVSLPHKDKILSCIERAKNEGGKILCGGEEQKLGGRCKNGYFVKPTVIEGLPNNCSSNCEEIFGPVVSIMPFKSVEDALEIANSTDYGLAGVIWTRDITRAHTLAGQIKAGIVWINSWMLRDLRIPFGGTKNSGIGREGGFESLRFFTEPKNVCVRLD